MIAVVSPSSTSTSGRASVGMKPCTKALYVSLISRCDSAAIVSNTSELLPEPETPVNTVSRRFGISTLTSLRLFTRAPSTRIRSWLSASCAAVLIVSPTPPTDAASLSTSSAASDETRRRRQDQRGGLEYPCRGPCADTHRKPGHGHGGPHEPPPVPCCRKLCPQPGCAHRTGVALGLSIGITATPGSAEDGQRPLLGQPVHAGLDGGLYPVVDRLHVGVVVGPVRVVVDLDRLEQLGADLGRQRE